jgi:hypothetical protein
MPLKKGGVKSSSKKPLKKGGVKGHTLPSSQNPPSELALLQEELTKMSVLIKSLKESQRASQRALSAINSRQNPPLEKPQTALSAVHHQLQPQSALSAINSQLQPQSAPQSALSAINSQLQPQSALYAINSQQKSQRKNKRSFHRLIERLKTQQYKEM